ncbi:2'-5' RNA ligase [Bacillus manliponensis]|uniref:RNA 2',3'-cyclic phosphodiesterase n=1 Tax=Bacillus manliponensis TaxID=574376 RepID=A0A073JW64_9BACI|nr:RNA 2',3'-cyclic phosphodiesterase [Bacillus manliponensis]KEK18432.1 2'-5' RNA ligase [Bacillus manliponensis]
MERHYFIAVTLQEHVKDALTKWKDLAEKSLPFRSFVYRDDYHITLSFLGRVESDRMGKLQQDLQQLGQTPQFPLSLTKFQTFGDEAYPRIFWMGVNGEPTLFQLQERVQHICKQNGFQLEDRPYRPHITVARKWQGEEAFQLDQLDELLPIDFVVEKVTLYETRMDRKPKYEAVCEVILQKV